MSSLGNAGATLSLDPLMRWLKFVARIAIAIVAVWAVALVGFFFYGARSMCGNEILAEYPSPDGELKAVVFERDCGTTTDFSTQVSVMKREAALENSKGNVFIEDSDRGRAPSGSGGGPEAKLLWTGNRSIQIDHHVNVRVSVARPLVDGVAVTYSSFQRQVV